MAAIHPTVFHTTRITAYFGNYPACRKCAYYLPPNVFYMKPGKCLLFHKNTVPLEYEFVTKARTDANMCGIYGKYFVPNRRNI